MGCSIPLRVARIKCIRNKTSLGSIVLLEAAVPENRETGLLHHAAELFLIHLLAPAGDSRLHIAGHVVNGISHHILEICAIGNMHINEELRQPMIVHLQPRLHLRCICL